MGFKGLDIVLELLSFLDEALLIGCVFLSVDLDLNGSFLDVHLQLASLTLGVLQQVLMSVYVSLQVLNNLHSRD